MKTFRQMVDSKEICRRNAFQINLDLIHEEPGFNLRVDDEELQESIEQLADFIVDGGKVPPLEVRPRDDGGVFVVDGHRRRRAYILARERGAAVDTVPVEPFNGTEAERVARILTSAEGRPLTALEQAVGLRRLIDAGHSAAEVGALISRSRQHVENILRLADMPDELKEAVREGVVSPTTAVKMVKKHGEKAGEKVKEALQTAKATGKKKVTETVARVGVRIPVALYEKLYATVEDHLNEGNKKTMSAMQAAFNEIADRKA